ELRRVPALVDQALLTLHLGLRAVVRGWAGHVGGVPRGGGSDVLLRSTLHRLEAHHRAARPAPGADLRLPQPVGARHHKFEAVAVNGDPVAMAQAHGAHLPALAVTEHDAVSL